MPNIRRIAENHVSYMVSPDKLCTPPSSTDNVVPEARGHGPIYVTMATTVEGIGIN